MTILLPRFNGLTCGHDDATKLSLQEPVSAVRRLPWPSSPIRRYPVDPRHERAPGQIARAESSYPSDQRVPFTVKRYAAKERVERAAFLTVAGPGVSTMRTSGRRSTSDPMQGPGHRCPTPPRGTRQSFTVRSSNGI